LAACTRPRAVVSAAGREVRPEMSWKDRGRGARSWSPATLGCRGGDLSGPACLRACARFDVRVAERERALETKAYIHTLGEAAEVALPPVWAPRADPISFAAYLERIRDEAGCSFQRPIPRDFDDRLWCPIRRRARRVSKRYNRVSPKPRIQG